MVKIVVAEDEFDGVNVKDVVQSAEASMSVKLVSQRVR